MHPNTTKPQQHGKNHTHRRPPHRKAPSWPLRGLAAPPCGAPELGRVRQDIRDDSRRAGPHRQRRQSRKNTPEHYRSGARLPLGGHRPGQDHNIHPEPGARAHRAGFLLYESRHREPRAAQPHGENRDKDAQFRAEHSRGIFLLPG